MLRAGQRGALGFFTRWQLSASMRVWRLSWTDAGIACGIPFLRFEGQKQSGGAVHTAPLIDRLAQFRKRERTHLKGDPLAPPSPRRRRAQTQSATYCVGRFACQFPLSVCWPIWMDAVPDIEPAEN